MKKLFGILFICALAPMGTFNCSTMQSLGVDLGDLQDISSSLPAGTTIGGIDFKSGDVLCATNDNKSLTKNYYKSAKVLKPATPATKNQAEVLFVDGKKKWTKFVIPSHKASKSEIRLGKFVLYHESAWRDELDENIYRKGWWYFGRVTSTDEMFKGIAEINGKKKNIKWLRISNQPITE